MAPNATFHLIFLGLGWPWVGEFVGFILVVIFTCFPTQHNLVNRKHPFAKLGVSFDEMLDFAAAEASLLTFINTGAPLGYV